MKIMINKTQNEKFAREQGYDLTVGTEIEIEVAGSVNHLRGAYELLDKNGRNVNGIPIGYGEDEAGIKYLVVIWKSGMSAYKE